MINSRTLLISLGVAAFLLLHNVHGAARNCEGSEDYPMQFLGGNMPDVIEIPSTFLMDTHMNLTDDLPADLVMDLKLTKYDPFPITVPCLDGIGSCVYDICYLIENNLSETWCPQFPPTQPCGCPLLEGEMNLVGLVVNVPDFGEVLNPLMEGNYDAVANFYGSSTPDEIVGCLMFNFTFVQANPAF